jgi:hypothetical protein
MQMLLNILGSANLNNRDNRSVNNGNNGDGDHDGEQYYFNACEDDDQPFYYTEKPNCPNKTDPVMTIRNNENKLKEVKKPIIEFEESPYQDKTRYGEMPSNKFETLENGSEKKPHKSRADSLITRRRNIWANLVPII